MYLSLTDKCTSCKGTIRALATGSNQQCDCAANYIWDDSLRICGCPSSAYLDSTLKKCVSCLPDSLIGGTG